MQSQSNETTFFTVVDEFGEPTMRFVYSHDTGYGISFRDQHGDFRRFALEDVEYQQQFGQVQQQTSGSDNPISALTEAAPSGFSGGLAAGGFTGSGGGSRGFSGFAGGAGSFSGGQSFARTFSASLISPLTGLSCSVQPLCDFLAGLCEGDPACQSGVAANCNASTILVPVELEPLVCAVIDFINCLIGTGFLANPDSPATQVAAQQCAETLIRQLGFEFGYFDQL